ncbi:MAG: DUF2079 domain-containing protein [Ruminococcus sp.]|nr:DUF2079 domain-containing protein [Ruminococcus sp.]
MSKNKNADQNDSVKDTENTAAETETVSDEAIVEAADDALKEAAAEAEEAVQAEADEKNVTGTGNSMMPDIGEPADDEGGLDSLPVLPEKKTGGLEAVANKINGLFSFFGIPDLALPRFIAAFFIISGYNLHSIRKEFGTSAVYNWREYVDKINGPTTFLFIAAVFMVLTTVYCILPKKAKISDQLLGIGSVFFFAIETVWRTVDSALGIGVIGISCVFIVYCADKLHDKNIKRRMPDWLSFIIAMAATVLVCWFVAYTTVLRHKTFCSSCFDLGIFVQMYHSLANDLTAVTTCERDQFLSHFYVHTSFIFYLLAPIYKLFPKEDTLLIAQAILSLGGIIPLFLIARRHKMHGLPLLFICLGYCFFPGLIGPCYYEFHENAFLPIILMWLLWAVDGKKIIMLYLMSALVCIVKEDAPLYAICVMMFFFFANKGDRKRLHGLIITFLCLAYMVFITKWLEANGDGNMMAASRMGHMMINYEGGLGEIAKNTLLNPAYFFSNFIVHKASVDGGNLNHKDTLTFFMQVMLPLIFVPFFTRKIHRFMLMIPFVVLNLVTGAGYGYCADIGFQYIFGSSCLLIYMSILNIDDMDKDKRRLFPVAIGSSAIIMSFTLFSNHIGYISTYKNNQSYYEDLEEMLDRIPADARVASEHSLLPHIADRDEVYLLHPEDARADEGILANREKYDCYAFYFNSTYESYKPFMESEYVVFDQIPGRAIIYMTPEYYSSISH